MGSILLINAAGRETRVALVENGHIAEFYLERKKDRGVVGNIYKGRVVRVLPGMQAAFVDIGLDKAAFLYVSDVVYDPDFARAQFELTEGEHEDAPEVPDELEDTGAASPGVPPEELEAPSLHAEVEHVDAHADALHEAASAALAEGGPEPEEPGADEDDPGHLDEPSDAAEPGEHAADEPLGLSAASFLDASPAASPVDAPANSGGWPEVPAEQASADAVPLPSPEPGAATLQAPDASGVPGPEAATSPGAAPASSPQQGPEQGERRARRELRERQHQERGPASARRSASRTS